MKVQLGAISLFDFECIKNLFFKDQFFGSINFVIFRIFKISVELGTSLRSKPSDRMVTPDCDAHQKRQQYIRQHIDWSQKGM